MAEFGRYPVVPRMRRGTRLQVSGGRKRVTRWRVADVATFEPFLGNRASLMQLSLCGTFSGACLQFPAARLVLHNFRGPINEVGLREILD